ncbi:hypothetical protein BDR04DRAFT_1159825 [Suillus decipiens]|nr:hypothetical protein BDR04DRAFT_1159825 [Suillus decipiens]
MSKDHEYKIGHPAIFDGDCEKSKLFILSCKAYMDINDKLLFNTGDIPETFDGIIKTCINIDNSYHHLQVIKNYHAPQKKTQKYRSSHYTSSCNPNTMEVNHLSQAEKAEHMRKGKCFLCHQTGHHTNGCPQKKKRKDTPA